MVFDFSDFENEAVGSIPAGWTLVEGNSFNDPSPYTRVVDTNTIQGDRSFRVGDSAGGGRERVSHPVGDEDIRFVGTLRRADMFGNSATVYLSVDSKYWFGFWTEADSSDGESFRVFYGTGGLPANDLTLSEQQTASTAEPGVVSSGFHRIELVDPTTSLKLKIDDSVFYDTGDSFSGQSTFYVTADDLTLITDTPTALYSDYVFRSGNAVRVQAGSQTYVNEGFDGEGRLIADTGSSGYFQISGNPVEDQSGN